MTVLRFRDQDGDHVAVLASAIVAISLGTLTGPTRRTAEAGSLTVTMIHLSGCGPLIVAAPFDEVLSQWVATLGYDLMGKPSGGIQAHAGVFPLVAHQYDPAGKAP